MSQAQVRNAEMIELLSADFVHRKESGYFVGQAFRLAADTAVSATTITVNQQVRGAVAGAFWVVIAAYTADCEIRRVTGVSGRTLTVAALNNTHAGGDSVLVTRNPSWDVTLFGAIPNGSTDCSAAIQAAIDDCIAYGGGIINLPGQGTYALSAGVSFVSAQGIRMVGSRFVTLDALSGFSGAYMVNVDTNSQYISFENIRLDGNLRAGLSDGLVFDGPNQCSAINVIVDGATDSGILVTGNAINTIIRDCNVLSCGEAGIEVGSSAVRTFISNNRLTTNTTYGVLMEGTYSTISGNFIYNTQSGPGIYANSVRVSIVDNRCYDTQGTKTQTYGLTIGASGNYLVIDGNDFEGNLTGTISGSCGNYKPDDTGTFATDVGNHNFA